MMKRESRSIKKNDFDRVARGKMDYGLAVEVLLHLERKAKEGIHPRSIDPAQPTDRRYEILARGQ